MTLLILTKIDTRAYREDEGDAPRLVKVAINSDRIRCFNPRREGAGTRITFADGGGFAVQETGSEILDLMGEATSIRAYEAPPVRPTPPTLTVVENGTVN